MPRWHSPMIGLIFGPPRSGKGTQAARVEREFDMEHLSTGEILRSEVAHGSAVGKEAGRRSADVGVETDQVSRIHVSTPGTPHSPIPPAGCLTKYASPTSV